MAKAKGIAIVILQGLILAFLYFIQVIPMKLRPSKDFLSFLYFLLSILLFWAGLSIYYPPPYQKLQKAVRISVLRGKSLAQLATELSQNGIILFKSDFLLCSRITGLDRKIKAGRYVFNYRVPALVAIKELAKGGAISVDITIPEGYNIFEIARVLKDSLGIDSVRFVEVAEDSAFMDSIGIPSTKAEGFLFPDTYNFTPDMSEREIILRMFKRFKEVVPEGYYMRACSLGLTFTQAITIASIIEKEGKHKEELPNISAVYHNRLRLGMRLQADPTVLYGIRVFNRAPTYADLESNSPYNTYKYPGLPPSPICNPGLEAIKAALYPEKNDYLYFVLGEGGKHIFSDNIEEHTKNVIKLRRMNKN